MKLIILILAHDSELSLKNELLWRKYMNLHSNIKCYFMKLKRNLKTEILIDNNTIFIKGLESLRPGCLVKTIKSIEYLFHI